MLHSALLILKFALALAVFALTLYLVTARPKGLQIASVHDRCSLGTPGRHNPPAP